MSNIDLIFHVDDDLDILELTRISLEMVGNLNIKQESNPQKALQIVKEIQPSLLLFDVMMPVLTGPQLFQEIRKLPEFTNIPVVYMTAKAQATEDEHLLGQGVLGVLTKPFDPMELPSEISRLWDTRH